jgi:hypothetical protein
VCVCVNMNVYIYTNRNQTIYKVKITLIRIESTSKGNNYNKINKSHFLPKEWHQS